MSAYECMDPHLPTGRMVLCCAARLPFARAIRQEVRSTLPAGVEHLIAYAGDGCSSSPRVSWPEGTAASLPASLDDVLQCLSRPLNFCSSSRRAGIPASMALCGARLGALAGTALGKCSTTGGL